MTDKPNQIWLLLDTDTGEYQEVTQEEYRKARLQERSVHEYHARWVAEEIAQMYGMGQEDVERVVAKEMARYDKEAGVTVA